ncbi:hypothetical protein Fmac_031141 [Flemingia macrophylla]|uniref:Transmembrane protein n=1 Tax=Flemingia macrophylla TaxID=520843 RepID=A0ABD1L166_9FABA
MQEAEVASKVRRMQLHNISKKVYTVSEYNFHISLLGFGAWMDAKGGNGGGSGYGGKKSSSHVRVIVCSVVGAVFVVSMIGFLLFLLA